MGVVKNVTVHFENVWMANPPEVCKERARAHETHEMLIQENSDDVIDSFCRDLRPPQQSGHEPYDAVHLVTSDKDAAVTIRRYADATQVNNTIQLPDSSKLAVTVASSADATHEANAFHVTAPTASAAASLEQAQSILEHVHEERDRGAGNSAEVFVLRHGERADRAKCRDGGWSDDPPLTKDGRETEQCAGCTLRGLAVLPWAPLVYSSSYYWCLQTANEVAAELGTAIRVEPGLSELCCQRIFDEQPQLREPEEASAAAFQRVELDTSVPPVQPTVPAWPEQARDASVLQAARATVSRRPGRDACLVCHGHPLFEITRTLPRTGGGATASQAGCCAMSHIDSDGRLLRSLGMTYLKMDRDALTERSSRFAPHIVDYSISNWSHG